MKKGGIFPSHAAYAEWSRARPHHHGCVCVGGAHVSWKLIWSLLPASGRVLQAWPVSGVCACSVAQDPHWEGTMPSLMLCHCHLDITNFIFELVFSKRSPIGQGTWLEQRNTHEWRVLLAVSFVYNICSSPGAQNSDGHTMCGSLTKLKAMKKSVC